MRKRPAIAIIENDKIMLLRYSYSGHNVYQFPGGNMDEGETLDQTVIRELKEELNLSVSIEKLLLTAKVIDAKNKETIHCLFKGNIQDSKQPIINPIETSALEVVWIGIKELDKINLYPSVGIKLQEILRSNPNETQFLGLIDQPWF